MEHAAWGVYVTGRARRRGQGRGRRGRDFAHSPASVLPPPLCPVLPSSYPPCHAGLSALVPPGRGSHPAVFACMRHSIVRASRTAVAAMRLTVDKINAKVGRVRTPTRAPLRTHARTHAHTHTAERLHIAARRRAGARTHAHAIRFPFFPWRRQCSRRAHVLLPRSFAVRPPNARTHTRPRPRRARAAHPRLCTHTSRRHAPRAALSAPPRPRSRSTSRRSSTCRSRKSRCAETLVGGGGRTQPPLARTCPMLTTGTRTTTAAACDAFSSTRSARSRTAIGCATSIWSTPSPRCCAHARAWRLARTAHARASVYGLLRTRQGQPHSHLACA